MCDVSHRVFPGSSSHLHPVKPRCRQTSSSHIWVFTSRCRAPAPSFATSLEGRLYLWGLFSPTHPPTVPLLPDYKDYQMYLRMKNRLFLNYLYLEIWAECLSLWFEDAWYVVRLVCVSWRVSTGCLTLTQAHVSVTEDLTWSSRTSREKRARCRNC